MVIGRGWSALTRCGAVMALALLLLGPAVAAEVDILLDLDNNSATGCAAATPAGAHAGVEQILRSTVQLTGGPDSRVSAVTVATCVAGSFAAPVAVNMPVAAPWPVGVSLGDDGASVVETYLPMSMLPAGTGRPALIRLTVVSSDGAQTDSVAAAALALDPLIALPTLGQWSLALLAMLLLGVALRTFSRRGASVLTLSLLLLATTAVWAAVSLDGNPADWSAADRLASDPADGGSVDLISLYGKEDSVAGSASLALRVDIAAPVRLQFLALSNLHGQVQSLPAGAGSPLGGAAALSSYFKADRLANPYTVTLSNGDAFGYAPPLSKLFDETPTVLAMNLMGVQFDTFGPANFDRGIAHLQSKIDSASYQHVASNLTNLDANLRGVAAFRLIDVGGVKVAVIGITNADANSLVDPGDMGTLGVSEPISAAMAARQAAAAAGAKVFVAICHLGVTKTAPTTGPLIDFANGVTGFHLIVGGETDSELSTTINGATVVQPLTRGRSYARVTLEVTPAGAILSRSATLVSALNSLVTPDPAVEAMLAPYLSGLPAQLDAVTGVAANQFVRDGNERLREQPIGNLVADALRLRYGTQLALMNGGGIRATLPSIYLPANTLLRRTSAGYAAGPPYDLVRGDTWTVLPFGNWAVTRPVTGATLRAMVENGLSLLPLASGRFPQISGFRVTYNPALPAGSRVLTLTLDDLTPIVDTTTYTVTVNDFLDSGGDSYVMLPAAGSGQSRLRDTLAAIVNDYIVSQGTITPTTDGRITAVP